jgi:hypothetical protein
MSQALHRSLLVSTLSGVTAMLTTQAAFAQLQFQDQTLGDFDRFPAQTEYTSYCSFGDLDGDTDLDIVFANGAGFNCPVTPQVLRIYINDGAGYFTDESVARTGGLTFRGRGVELGDIERDGDLDIIVAQDCVQKAALLVNDGLGFFTNDSATRIPNVNMSSSRGQFGDLDNDGDLDLFFCNGGTSRFGTGPNKVFLNDGLGFYTDYSATAMAGIASVGEPMDAILGDIDGDFDLDANVGARGGLSRLYTNDGSSVFTQVTFPADGATYSYDFGDINGDGDLDLLGANAGANNAEQLLGNNGAGVYSVLAFPALGVDDNDSKFFDYDNDNDLDLIVCRIGGPERIYTNNGTGTFVLATGLITSVTDSSLDVKVADLTGDGRLDIVTAQGESGGFQDRIYVNISTSDTTIDNREPKIINTEQVVVSEAAGPYAVRVVIYDDHTSDRGFHDKGVYLNYSVDGGPESQVQMDWSGNALWRGVIPEIECGEVAYYVTATDFNNNTATGPTLTYSAGPCTPVECDADISPPGKGDGEVGAADLGELLANWGACGDPKNCPADIAPADTGDDVVDAADLGELLANWGQCE